MPANTPIFGFPYPLGSDPVRNGADDIRDLALAVETEIFDGNVIGYRTRTTNYTIFAGGMGSAADMFSSAITFTSTATNSYLLELNFMFWMDTVPNGYVCFNFVDSGNPIDNAASFSGGNETLVNSFTVCHRYIWKPGSAASRSINARGVVGNGATADARGAILVLGNDGTYYPWMAVYDLGVLP